MEQPDERGQGVDGVEDVVEVLQRERDLLERLRFRFVSLELLLAAAEVRFLDWAVHDVQLARHRAREADLVRAAAIGALRLEGADGAPSLREVAAAADPPWAGILRDHHDSLCVVVAEIEMHGHRVAQACRDGLAALAHTGRLTPSPVSVPSGGGDGEGGDVASLRAAGDDELDPLAVERILSDVLASTGRLRMPALLAFLR